VSTSEDDIDRTSFETYLRGELSTYSLSTLALLARFIINRSDTGQNLSLLYLENIARGYGYESAASAEETLTRRYANCQFCEKND